MLVSIILLQALSTDVEDQIAVQMCRAVNRERVSRGLLPLRPHQALTQSAYSHANDMLARKYFDHISPEGTGFAFRCSQNRYFGIPVAENLYFASFQVEAEPVVADWMGSSGHRKNVLSPEATEIGLGMAGKRARYVVMVVGKKSAAPLDEARVFGIEKDEQGKPFVRLTSPVLGKSEGFVPSTEKINQVVIPMEKGEPVLAAVGGVYRDFAVSATNGLVVNYGGVEVAPGIRNGQSVLEGQVIGFSQGRATFRIQSPAYGFFDPKVTLERASKLIYPAYPVDHGEFLPMSQNQIRWDAEIVAVNENRRTMIVHLAGEIDWMGQSRGETSVTKRSIAFDTLDFSPKPGSLIAIIGKKVTGDQVFRASAILVLRN